MNAGLIVASMLGIAALIGIALGLRRGGHARLLRGVLQIAAAALLYLCLFPPETRENFAAGELVVLTPGTTEDQLDALNASADTVALPGALAARGTARTPDLGTALRHHPDAHRLRIVGGGLPPRDLDAARGRVAGFDAAALPRGLVELDAPASVRAGQVWRIGGRVQDVAGGHVELRDPAAAQVASVALAADGRFALALPAKGEGAALFTLRVLDRDGGVVEELPLPLVARRGERLTLRLLAGAPDPELKYLRRWAADAGIEVDSRLGLSEGIAFTEGAIALDASTLRATDLLVIDERAWAMLADAQKQALTEALRDGLGLLLRVTGPLPPAVAAEWAALGFRVQAHERSAEVSLDRALGLDASGLRFAPHAITVEATAAAPLLRADDGTALALWRAEGQGRIALWWLADSFRLALGGQAPSHASLWAGVVQTLARPHAGAEPVLPLRARVDERTLLCAVSAGDTVLDAQGKAVELVVETSMDGLPCAAYWPAEAGWHHLLSGGRQWPFHVQPATAAAALAHADAARATRALLGTQPALADVATRARTLPRWPWFLAWLATIGGLWWLERRARAIPAASPAAPQPRMRRDGT